MRLTIELMVLAVGHAPVPAKRLSLIDLKQYLVNIGRHSSLVPNSGQLQYFLE